MTDPLAVARECVGGPFDGDLRAVDGSTVSVTVPLPVHLRSNRLSPEWACYRVMPDERLHFVSRGTNFLLVHEVHYRESE